MAEIQVKNLTYVYSKGSPYEMKALDNVNITFRDNAITGLIGHTGSGKSTLVQMLNGLLRPDEGEILLDGKNIWENPKKIENSRYFYSDYIKGAAVEAGVTIMVPYVFPDYFKPTFTVAMDAVMNKSRLSMDYQIGFGLSFNLDNIIRLKK